MAEDLLSTLIGLVRFRVRSNLPIAGFSVVIFPGEGQLLNPRTYDFLSNVFFPSDLRPSVAGLRRDSLDSRRARQRASLVGEEEHDSKYAPRSMILLMQSSNSRRRAIFFVNLVGPVKLANWSSP